MAPARTVQLCKMISLLIIQFTALCGLTLQLHGLITLWKIYETQRNDALLASIIRKRNYFLDKLKKARPGRLRGNAWWENMLGGIAPEESWEKF